jgi:hypothetical protein
MLKNIKIIFFHIEKSMGSSMRIILKDYFKNIYKENEIYLPENYNNVNLINITQYNYINDLSQDFKILLCHMSYKTELTNSLCNNIFSISVVRNPYTRIISHYYFFDYAKYKKKLYELNDGEIINIINNCGNLILKRLGNKEKINEIDCILILENIDDDLIKFNKILNNKFKKKIKLKLIKKNKNKNYNDSLDADHKFLKIYEEYFNEDIELYNYIVSLPINKRLKNSI